MKSRRLIAPTSYRGIIALAKKHDIVLTPRVIGNKTHACVISMLGIVNDPTTLHPYCDFSNILDKNSTLGLKLYSIEVGFDGTQWTEHIDPKFVAIGQKLSKYAERKANGPTKV